jgi:hypothetical protein
LTQAREEGRRLWFDEASYQLSIVDYPVNLDRIDDFVDSMPGVKRR